MPKPELSEREAINEGINEAIEDHPERWTEPDEDETDFLSLVIEEENFLEPKSRSFRKHTIGECLERMKNRNGSDDDYYDGGDYEYDWNATSFESYLKDSTSIAADED